MTEPAPHQSDLGVRVVSAVVMVAVAGTALWLGGWVWIAFVALVALGVLWEWRNLVFAFAETVPGRSVWLIGGLVYVGLAASELVLIRNESSELVLFAVGAVVATDIGAYFVGRMVGGPKIAPRISPSKTWAGLFGGALGASAWFLGFSWYLFSPGAFGFSFDPTKAIPLSMAGGTVVAVVAQTGDFFESWMKRRAGVKDSGALIPGHGGLFDRVDGLISVLFAIGLAMVGTIAVELASGGSLLPTPA